MEWRNGSGTHQNVDSLTSHPSRISRALNGQQTEDQMLPAGAVLHVWVRLQSCASTPLLRQRYGRSATAEATHRMFLSFGGRDPPGCLTVAVARICRGWIQLGNGNSRWRKRAANSRFRT